MATSGTSWKKGQSGNAQGSSSKMRELTRILTLRGKMINPTTGLSGEELVADLVWQGVTTGEVKFPNGEILVLGSGPWREMVKFLYDHVDGPARAVAVIDVKREAEKIAKEMGLNPADILAQAEEIMQNAEG
jgi:hypothetical protein